MGHITAKKATDHAVATDEFSEGLNPSPEFMAKWAETREARHLAAVLVEMREMAGLSQIQIAKLMGKDQASVSRMESATQLPKSANVALYAKHCGMRTVYAFIDEDNSDSNHITVHRMTEIGQGKDTPDICHLEDVSIRCK